MKDSNFTFTAAQKRRELWTLLLCFITANILNVISIVVFDTTWDELYTSLGYVATLAVVLYIIWTVVRVVCSPLIKRFKR